VRSKVKSAGVLGAVTVAVIALAIALPQLGGKESGAQEPGKAFVPPGKLDEYYMFASGGHSGQVYVFGIPSMRRIRTIPVFTPDPATGWGYDEHSKKMLGGYTWGDVHHPALSETRGEYDGRWLFVNDNANNRVARIDLKTFTVGQILGPVPNIMGPHCAAFVTPNTEYFMMPSRFSAPIPTGTYAPLSEYGKKYYGVLAAIAVDPKSGEMRVGWELLLPPWQYDLSDAGKKVSEGWAFLTTYNTEEATTVLEKNASKNDRDYIIALNWREVEKAVQAGKFTTVAGVKVVDPTKVPGLVYLIPVAKSPHGVDVSPDGRYVVASGKLQPAVTVYEFARIQEAIKKKDFAGTVRGLPVLNYESVRVAEVPVGLGPLHTQFDDKGFAYTSLFLDSAIAKWQLGTWKVVDKVQINYNVGHLAAAEGDSASPDGKYLVSLNKMAKDRFLSVGPSHPESLQLIDISGSKMRVIADAPVDPEPHYAQIVKADKIKTIEIHPKESKRPYSVWSPKDARIERKGNEVHVYMYAIRSRYVPDNVEVNQGDRVFFHITNNDLDEDLTHGFGISLYNVNMEIQPGETKTISIVAERPGVYPFYCTNFCSALHQEMQGYLLVKPKK
jgi:nitrous-oxide reductase